MDVPYLIDIPEYVSLVLYIAVDAGNWKQWDQICL
jgi:hypothetical protein